MNIEDVLKSYRNGDLKDSLIFANIRSFLDDTVMDELIERRKEFKLDNLDITNLLTVRPRTFEYTDKYIKRRKEFRFINRDIIRLICNIEYTDKDQYYKYMDQYIERRKELRFTKFDIMRLLFNLANPEYTEKYIERRTEFNFTKYDIIGLVSETKNIKYIESYIKRRKEFEFDNDDIVRFVCSTRNFEYISSYIERRKEFGFDKNNIINLLFSIDNPEYIRSFIEEQDEYEWEDKEIFMLEVLSGNIDYVDSFDDNSGATINLPSKMTVGIEIETFGEMPREKLEKLVLDWKCKDDDSLIPSTITEIGTEIVSPSNPLLTGDNIETTKRIRRICTILNVVGQYVNRRCAGHIHIGADYLTSVQAWQNLIEIWMNSESIIYIIGNKKGEIPRISILDQAAPISKDFYNMVNSGKINLSIDKDLEEFKKKLCNAQGKRTKGMNFKNLSEDNKHTIEFRLPNGTIDSNTWIENINLFGGLIKIAEDLANIQQKVELERTEEEKNILVCFENIRNKKLTEQETLEQLLQMVIPEENRECYRQRYKINARLLEANSKLKNSLKKKFAEGAIIIGKQELGRRILATGDRVTGDEYGVASGIISEGLMSIKDKKKEK
ncbi:MAG TPA: hypothetical protein DEP51_00935 [Clostridiales bacterium]|nr:hypothetical protein [Clostridiales bacterium]